MLNDLPEPLRELAQFQRGIITAGQALSTGLTREAIRWRLQDGAWQRVYTGVYAVFSGELSRPAELWAAVCRAGPGAALSHQTAAELFRLIDSPSTLTHVTIPASRRVLPGSGLVIHTSERVARTRHPALSPPRVRIEETVVDLANLAATAEDAYDWVTRALGRRLTTQELLSRTIELRPRVRWRSVLAEAVSPDQAGVHSRLERRYVRDVERPHRLPHGRRQARAERNGRSEYRDVLYEKYALVIELDGRAAHPGDSRWRDIRRDNAAADDELTTLRFGWFDVFDRACLTAVDVLRVLRLRGYTGYRPCSPGCPVALLC
jgi:hypothetical protein